MSMVSHLAYLLFGENKSMRIGRCTITILTASLYRFWVLKHISSRTIMVMVGGVTVRATGSTGGRTSEKQRRANFFTAEKMRTSLRSTQANACLITKW